MKKAVMYGAGNIGRGFIGALFSQSVLSIRRQRQMCIRDRCR